MASATATLLVRRPPHRMRDAGRSYRIELDGEPHGHVGPGETQVWKVPPGKYRVQAKIDWTGSAPLEVDLVEGTTVWLAVEPKSWIQWTLGGMRKSGYLRLSRVEGDRVRGMAAGVGGVSGHDPADPAGSIGSVSGVTSDPGPLAGDRRVREVSARAGLAPAGDPRAAWAVVLTVAGGLIGLVGYLVALPPVVWLVALSLFTAGTAVVVVLTYRDARAGDMGFWHALWRSIRAAGSWVFWMMP